MIDANLHGTARTLVLTLRARADEQERQDSLLEDSWSEDWMQYLPEYDDLNRWYEANPTFRVATIIRTRLIDEAVQEWLKGKKNPVVVEFGAGLSTRYYRLQPDKVVWIEQDLGMALALREKMDKETDSHWFLPGDFTEMSWLDRMPEVDPKQTLFIAEGVLMFAEPDGVTHLFNTLGERYSGATFIFDVVNPGYIERASEAFDGLRAPMRWGVMEDDLPSYGVKIKDRAHLLLEYPERWDEIGVTADKRNADNSGYVVVAQLA
jgi:O-methyltransferase involved in polyketide biosynthesis